MESLVPACAVASAVLLVVACGGGKYNADLGIRETSGASTWTEYGNPNNLDLYGVVYAESQFVAVGESTGANPYLLTSPEGRVWTIRTMTVPVAVGAFEVTHGEGIYVAVGAVVAATEPLIITSPDGITWTRRSPTSPRAFAMNAIAHDGDSTFVAVGSVPGSVSYILRSTNAAVNWAEQVSPVNSSLLGVFWSTKHSLFIAMGSPLVSGDGPYIVTSPTGEVWTQRLMSLPASVSGIASLTEDPVSGLLVAVGGSDGTDALILVSRNAGVTWQEQTNPRAIQLNGVSFATGLFMALGESWVSGDAYFLRSKNGVDWTEVQNPKARALNAITHDGAGLWIGVGDADGSDAYIVRM